jgi:hypothetical protein
MGYFDFRNGVGKPRLLGGGRSSVLQAGLLFTRQGRLVLPSRAHEQQQIVSKRDELNRRSALNDGSVITNWLRVT